jgi:2-methylcitrate dehydratase PrpD
MGSNRQSSHDRTAPTRQLAWFAAKLKYGQLPGEVIAKTKVCVLDALGCILNGSTQPWGKIIGRYAKGVGGKSESVLVGSSRKVSAGSAALAHGTMAHAFEADDVYIPAIQHPGAVVVPAALAAAEREGASGKELIAAVTAGYEVMNRIGRAFTESHLLRGFFPTGTNGTFGAAAAAGNLLHLTEEQMIDALGIAGNQSAGIFEGVKEGRMTKRFGSGRAAQSGLLAADLARLGFTGPTSVVEGDWGYLRVYSDRWDIASVTDGLGKTYTIMETTFKPYPCCKALHAAIDGVLELQAQNPVDPEQVEEIIVGGYEKLVRMHDIYKPATSMAAQFSIPYVVSYALLKGRPGLEAFTDRAIRDKRVLGFARKVKTVVDPEVAPYFPANEPAKVTIHLEGGERPHSQTVIHSKGTPQNPMTPEEFEAKFRAFAAPILSLKRAEKTIETVQRLENLKKVSQLSSLLGRKK